MALFGIKFGSSAGTPVTPADIIAAGGLIADPALTENTLPRAGTAGELVDSQITDDGTDVSVGAAGSLFLSSNGQTVSVNSSGVILALSGPDGTITLTAINGVVINGYPAANYPIVTPSSPTTGQTVTSNTNKLDETLLIQPAGTLLALTVQLPVAISSREGQIIRGFISQIITGLTVTVAGSGTVIGATPATAAVNSVFAYQCSSVAGNGTWIRIQ